MASTGNVFPGTGANDASIGATAWTNPGNIVSDNATDASCNAAASSQYLVAKNFNFASVPTNATINGITVRIEAAESSAGSETLNVRLQDDGGALTGTGKTASINGTSPTVYTLGSTSDLWSATVTGNKLHDIDWGVRFWFTTAHNMTVDYVTMAVEYTVPSPGVATETDTALALSITKVVAHGFSSESDSAQKPTIVRPKATGRADSTETALAPAVDIVGGAPKARHFNSANGDSLAFTSDPTSSPLTAITVMGWVRFDTNDEGNNGSGVIWKDTPSHNAQPAYAISRDVGNSGKYLFWVCPDDTTSIATQSMGSALTTNTWYFFVGRWQSGQTSSLRVYDEAGSLVLTTTSASTITGSIAVNSSKDVWFGRDFFGNFNGDLQRFRVYGSRLSDASIEAERQDKSDDTGALLHAQLTEAGSTENDVSGHFSAGTFTGTTRVTGPSPTFLISSFVATESDSSIARSATKIVAHGFSSETDSALAPTVQIVGGGISVGLAAETDAALARSVTKIAATGVATETDTAVARAVTKSVATARANETDAAFARGWFSLRATESDSAFARSAIKVASTGRSNESDTAFSLALTKRISTGIASETDTAVARAAVKLKAIGVATESDTALARSAKKLVALGRSEEFDSALSLFDPTQTVATGRSNETDAALALSARKVRAVGVGGETDVASALATRKLLQTTSAAESDVAIQRSVLRLVSCGPAVEVDAALAQNILKRLSGNHFSSEFDLALALGVIGGVPFSQAQATMTLRRGPHGTLVTRAAPSTTLSKRAQPKAPLTKA